MLVVLVIFLLITINVKYSEILSAMIFSLKKSKTLYSGHLLIADTLFSGSVGVH